MATSSIFKNIIINSVKEVHKFADALKLAEEIAFLRQHGWVIHDGSAYESEDIEFKIPYDIEGTYKAYKRGWMD